MKQITYSLLAVACMLALSGCSKKSSAPVVPKNTLCDGGTLDSWFPLSVGNYWNYTINSSSSYVINVDHTESDGSFTYYNVSSAFSNFDRPLLREDGATKDIYNDYGHIEVPGSPTMNQVIVTYGGISKIVTNTNATITTASCTYSGCLEITQYNGSTVDFKVYFKRKVGIVYYVNSSGQGYPLGSLTLQ